jgi:ParB family chromosome partitioning protein
MGHARAIITVEDEKNQLLILQKILEKKLSVRQVEETVRNIALGKLPHVSHPHIALPQKIENAKASLKARLQSKVLVKVGPGGSGKIIITFNSDEEFDRIISKLES